MLIILEGPRNSGKTTAATKLKEQFGENAYLIKFQRTTKPAPPVFMTEFLSEHWLALIDSRSICILDRFHLTEFVMRTLDGKVNDNVLTVTTHMIDTMLKNIKAVTYVLKVDEKIRHARLAGRDIDHREKEWLSYKELDVAWASAVKTFHASDVRVWPGASMSDIDNLVKDAINYSKGGKPLGEKIPFLPPILKVDELVAEVV